jgi:microcystin-dependent protein
MAQQSGTTAAPQPGLAPIGSIVAYAGNLPTLPSNWLVCDGSLVSVDDYKELYGVIGSNWGLSGDQFNLPYLCGTFLRGVDQDGQGNPINPPNDPDRNSRISSQPGGNTGNTVGSLQAAAVGPHTHDISGFMGITAQPPQHNSYNPYDNTPQYFTFNTVSTESPTPVGGDTRPLNAYVWWIIRAK